MRSGARQVVGSCLIGIPNYSAKPAAGSSRVTRNRYMTIRKGQAQAKCCEE